MATWHRLGDKAEVLARVPCSVKVHRHSITVFCHDGIATGPRPTTA